MSRYIYIAVIVAPAQSSKMKAIACLLLVSVASLSSGTYNGPSQHRRTYSSSSVVALDHDDSRWYQPEWSELEEDELELFESDEDWVDEPGEPMDETELWHRREKREVDGVAPTTLSPYGTPPGTPGNFLENSFAKNFNCR